MPVSSMEYYCSDIPTATIAMTTSPSSSPSSTVSPSLSSPNPATGISPPPSGAVVVSPCAACKILRRRCAEKCVLAPYFPPNDPLKFTTAHRVFGASNIIKFLQELPENQRADAVSSMVYEANARLRDPVYGCAGAICQLQKQVSELQAQVAKAQAELFNMHLQQANLMAIICTATQDCSTSSHEHHQYLNQQYHYSSFDDDNNNNNNMGTKSSSSPMSYNNPAMNTLQNQSFMNYDDANNNNVNYNLGSFWESLWA